jgi:hypothetical protein
MTVVDAQAGGPGAVLHEFRHGVRSAAELNAQVSTIVKSRPYGVSLVIAYNRCRGATERCQGELKLSSWTLVQYCKRSAWGHGSQRNTLLL